MYYIRIPIKSEQEGIDLAENRFGAMMWRRMDDRSVKAYPYDGHNPIVIRQSDSLDSKKPSALGYKYKCNKCGSRNLLKTMADSCCC